MRATLTIIEDANGVVRWLSLGQAIDLLPAERNIVGRSDDALVSLTARSISQRLDVHIQSDAWVVRTSGPGARIVTNDGDRELAVGEDAPLIDGTLMGWPGLTLRFDVVKERPLARLQRRGDALLFDCGGGLGPGRWPCLTRVELASGGARAERGLIVAAPGAPDVDAESAEGLDRERHLGELGHLMPARRALQSMAGFVLRRFDAVDGVPLKLVCRRGRGLEPAIAVRLAARVARWLVETGAPLSLGTSSFALTWDGDLAVLPPLAPHPPSTEGRGVIVELFVTLFPETGDWFQENDAGSLAARALWHRLVDPYLGAFGARSPEADDLVDAASAADALEDAAHALPAVSREDLARIVRGLFPDEWRFESELREELALLDARSLDHLFASP